MDLRIVVIAQALIAGGIAAAAVHHGKRPAQHLLKHLPVLQRHTPHVAGAAGHRVAKDPYIDHQTAHSRAEGTSLDNRPFLFHTGQSNSGKTSSNDVAYHRILDINAIRRGGYVFRPMLPALPLTWMRWVELFCDTIQKTAGPNQFCQDQMLLHCPRAAVRPSSSQLRRKGRHSAAGSLLAMIVLLLTNPYISKKQKAHSALLR